jgi:single-stranded-DNA-specific exonuclease
MGDSAPAVRWVRPAARWLLPQVQEAAMAGLQRELGIARPAAAVLCRRGFEDPKLAQEFLSPSLDALADPFLLADMDRAVTRLLTAIESKELILLYGDYDVDGTSSVVVLKKTIEILGGQSEFHIPHRIQEGYGMRNEVIEKAAVRGVRLIVSVDTGIRATAVVRHANAAGIDVIVTDHHLPDAQLPPALAVVNPNRPDCLYPDKNLCGAGVAFKLVQALLGRTDLPTARQRALLDSFLKPVAIATVADIVPLVGENRIIVRRGLSGLAQVRNLGLRCLLEVAGFEEGEPPSAHQVAFRLAPRINAAGRMATAKAVIELFLTDDAQHARRLAEQLDVLNRERQQREAEIIESILAGCEAQAENLEAPALVFCGPNWHVGVLGIVASRLVERFCRPVFVLSEAAEQEGKDSLHLSGSGRSIPGFHLLEALESMPELFQKFGGHKQAAGLTLPAANLETFRRRFADFAGGCLSADSLRPQYTVDAQISFAELTDRVVQQILGLGPFGFGNPAPLWMSAKVEVAGPVKVLKEGKHLMVTLRQDGRTLVCKAWNFAERAEIFTPGSKVDVLFHIEDDPGSRRRGYGSWCVSLRDVRPVSPLDH